MVKLNGTAGFSMVLMSTVMLTVYGSVLNPTGDMVTSIPLGRPSTIIGPMKTGVVPGTRVILNLT